MILSPSEALARRLALVLGLGSAACGTNDHLPTAPTSPPGLSAPTPPPAVASASAPAPAPAPAPEAPTPAAPARSGALAGLKAEVGAELARLRGLQIVEVGDLVLRLPDQAHACYGACSPADWDAIVLRAYERQLPRLHKLVDEAVKAKTDTYPVPIDRGTAEKDLAALNGLAIASLGDLVVAQPANNPNCYNLPCDSDIAVAKNENGFRAFYLRVWAGFAENEKP